MRCIALETVVIRFCNATILGDRMSAKKRIISALKRSLPVYGNILNRDEYDVRELASDPFPPDWHVDYLNTEKFQVRELSQ